MTKTLSERNEAIGTITQIEDDYGSCKFVSSGTTWWAVRKGLEIITDLEVENQDLRTKNRHQENLILERNKIIEMQNNLAEIQAFVKLQALGKNLTLAVVLDTLHHRGEDSCGVYGANINHADFETCWITTSGAASGVIDLWHCKWDLEKSFLRQSSETQLAIARLLGWEESNLTTK